MMTPDEYRRCKHDRRPTTDLTRDRVTTTGGLTGIDLVRRTLEEARAAARAQGKDAGRGRGAPPLTRRVAGQRRSWSGPGPDIRDPQPLGRLARDLAKKRGWSTQVAEGTVLGHWPSVVGHQIADHATPTALNDGVLSVAAESTAWATQLRMVQAQIVGQDRRGGWQRRRDLAEDHRPGRTILAERTAAHRRQRAA